MPSPELTILAIQVITTRKFDERLETLEAVRSAGISVCSGGIIGLGEAEHDRVGLIYEMSQCVDLGTSVYEAYADDTPACTDSPRHPSRSR